MCRCVANVNEIGADMDTFQLWMEILKVLVTTAATGVAAFFAIKISEGQLGIARQQAMTASSAAKTAQAKLNLDLFHLRYDLFEKVWDFLSGPIQTENTDLTHPHFTNLIPKARFLFGDEIANFMLEASKNRTALAMLLKRQSKGGLDDRSSDQMMELQTWFYDEASSCHYRFADYLDFSTWRADPIDRLLRGGSSEGRVKLKEMASNNGG